MFYRHFCYSTVYTSLSTCSINFVLLDSISAIEPTTVVVNIAVIFITIATTNTIVIVPIAIGIRSVIIIIIIIIVIQSVVGRITWIVGVVVGEIVLR